MEIWKNIENYEGLYQVSNLGQVKSLKSNKILKPRPNKKGYLRVCLYNEGKRKEFSLHRLVAIAFLPNEDNLPQVDHLDNDKTNNKAENLQWITNVENNRKKTSGIMIPRKVICLESDQVFESVVAAANYVNKSSITMNNHLNGKTKTCGGLHFEYYNGDDAE